MSIGICRGNTTYLISWETHSLHVPFQKTPFNPIVRFFKVYEEHCHIFVHCVSQRCHFPENKDVIHYASIFPETGLWNVDNIPQNGLQPVTQCLGHNFKRVFNNVIGLHFLTSFDGPETLGIRKIKPSLTLSGISPESYIACLHSIYLPLSPPNISRKKKTVDHPGLDMNGQGLQC